LFFTSEDKSTLWYSKEIGARIDVALAPTLSMPPEGATTVERGGLKLASPQFVKKKGQRVHWSSRFTISLTAFRFEPDPAVIVPRSSSGVINIPSGVSQANVIDLSSSTVDPQTSWTTNYNLWSQPVVFHDSADVFQACP
jgi:hypothetical protein